MCGVLTVAAAALQADALRADESLYVVNEGVTGIAFDESALSASGLGIAAIEPSADSLTTLSDSVGFAIDRSADLPLLSVGGGEIEFLAGRLDHIGGFVIVANGAELVLDDFVIEPHPLPSKSADATVGWLQGSTSDARPALRLAGGRYAIAPRGDSLVLARADLILTPSAALWLGVPDAANRSIAVVEFEASLTKLSAAGADQDSSNQDATPTPAIQGAIGPDVTLCQLYDLEQFGAKVGDVAGLGVATDSFNIGGEQASWFMAPDDRHPFIAMNLYRLEDDRFEQIGQSWIKHGFLAFADEYCTTNSIPEGCTPPSCEVGSRCALGVGCTDLYGANLNAYQPALGPRYEVNPWTGDWSSNGTLLSQPAQSDIHKRLQVHDADIDPVQNPGAIYYAEGFYCHFQDINVLNSAAFKPVTPSAGPDNTWLFAMSPMEVRPEIGFAIKAWSGAALSTVAQDTPVVEFVSPDGRCVLACKATDLQNGTWHYEYALLNIDMDRQVGAFSVPLPSDVSVSSVGFHAVEHHGEATNAPVADGGVPIDNAPWNVGVSSNAITWSTTGNPLRWGTLYNFRFDADLPPNASTATLSLFKPGVPPEVTGSSIAPGADCNTNALADDLERVVYVDPDATGVGSGRDWTNAFTDLSDALIFATTNACAVREVWVKAGAYYPSTVGLADPRSASFQLVDGLAVYGGFAGGETSPNERDLAAQASILSGDIDGNDGTSNGISNYIHGQNSYHVVIASGVGASAILDGFVVTGGDASGVGLHEMGGGMLNLAAGPSIVNCRFAGNSALSRGGAMFSGAGSLPVIRNCAFENNTAELTDGGAIVFADFGGARLRDCSFFDNLAILDGGAVSIVDSADVRMDGCRFYGNTCGGGGGAVFLDGAAAAMANCAICGNTAFSSGGALSAQNSALTVSNCTLTANGATSGGTLHANASQSTFVNCILWQDQPDEIAISGGPASSVRFSNVFGGWPGLGNIADDPRFLRDPDDGGDGWGVGGNDDFGDLRLRGASVCSDAGSNGVDTDLNSTGIQALAALDMDGDPRLVDDAGMADCPYADVACGDPPIVDMGAFERQSDTLAGDLDGDGDIDLADFARLADCLAGPNVTIPPVSCTPVEFDMADVDADGDVDLGDAALMSLEFTGP